jgi:predicted DNA-binding ArsR family transcriptional regulator
LRRYEIETLEQRISALETSGLPLKEADKETSESDSNHLQEAFDQLKAQVDSSKRELENRMKVLNQNQVRVQGVVKKSLSAIT